MRSLTAHHMQMKSSNGWLLVAQIRTRSSMDDRMIARSLWPAVPYLICEQCISTTLFTYCLHPPRTLDRNFRISETTWSVESVNFLRLLPLQSYNELKGIFPKTFPF